MNQKKLFRVLPDGHDGLVPVPFESNAGNTMSVDPIAATHGDYFVVQGDGNVVVNQVAVAAKFAHDMHIHYDEAVGCFRQYDARIGFFALAKEPQVKWALAEFLKRLAEENHAETFLAKRTNSLCNAILQLVRGYAMEVDQEFASRDLFHAGNGMLDIKSEGVKLLPFDPRYRSKKFCPVNYVPSADCPRFMEELLAPAVLPEDIGLLQRWCGALLLGGNHSQRFLLVYGTAAAGKSTFVDIVEQIIGLENVGNIRSQHLGGRFETHGYLDKALLTARDVSSDFLCAKGAKMIKALVGNDVIEVERKFGGKTRLRGNLNLVLTSNARLQLKFDDDVEAWRRRLLVVEFNRKVPPQRIPNFAQRVVQEEGEGILAWMVQGAVEHLRELDESGDYHLMPDQRTRIDGLLNESQSVECFVTQCLSFELRGDVSVEEIREGYFEFCEKRKWQPVTTRQLENALSDLMLKIHSAHRRNDVRRNGNFVRGFKNMELKVE